jgi:hypothetical protein
MVVPVARSSVQRAAASADRPGTGKSAAASSAIENTVAATLAGGEPMRG